MTSSHKKVIVRRMTGELLAGYLPAAGLVRGQSTIELLDLSGRVVSLELGEIKMVSYVREFNRSDIVNPERLVRRVFLRRPRNEGLWVRLTLKTGELLEGLASADLALLEAIGQDQGLHLTPPDARSNTQHLYIPRLAIAAFEVVGVITSPSRPRPAIAQPSIQEELFQAVLPPNARPN